METLESREKYKLLPPEGGWGYVVTLSVIVINVSSIYLTIHTDRCNFPYQKNLENLNNCFNYNKYAKLYKI